MPENSRYKTGKGRTALVLGVVIASAYWISEGMVHAFAFERGGILEALFPSDLHELLTRIFVVCTIIGFGVYSRLTVNKLHDSSERYRALFENAPDAIFLADSESGVITDANPAASRLLLRPLDEIVGLHQSKLHPPVKRDDSTRIFMAQVEDSKKGKRSRPAEHVILRSDGVEVPVEIMANTIDLEGRSVLQGIFRDVTERKEMGERNEAILQTSIDGFWLLDATGQILEVNDAYCRMSGYSRDELLTMKIEDVEASETQQEIRQHLQAIIDAGSNRFETQQRRKDGTIVDLDISANYLVVDGGRIFAFFRDITEFKRLERELSLSEEKYRTFFENALTGDFISTPDGDLIDCNQAFLDIFGFTSIQEAQSSNMESLYPTPQAREAMLDRISKEKKIVHYEHEVRKTTGEAILVDQNTVGEFDDDNNLVIMRGHIIDITDRKRAEQELSRERDLLQTLLDSSNDYIYFKDRDRRYVRASSSFCDLFARPMEDIVGKTDDYFLPLEVREAVADDDRQVIEKAMPIINKEQGGTIGEEEHWVLTTKLPWRDAKDQIIGLFGISRDITLRRRTQNALIESEQKYRTLLTNIPGMVYRGKPDWSVDFISDCKSICGYSPQEFYEGQVSWIDIVHPEDKERVRNKGSELTFTNGSIIQEYRITTKGGDIRWIEDHKTSSYAKDGSLVGVDGVVFDVTPRKKAEEELRKFKMIADRAGYGVGIVDVNGTLLYANESFADMHGFKAGELIGKNLSIFHTEEQMERVNELNRRLIEDGRYVAEEVWHKRTDNTVFPALMNATVIKSEKGEPLFLAATAVDISERTRLAKVLRDSEERYRTLVESAGAAITAIDANGTFLFMNKTGAERLGGKPEDLVGKTMWDVFPTVIADQQVGNVQKVMDTGEGMNIVSLTVVRGESRWYNTILEPLRDVSGDIGSVMVIARDIHEQKQAEEHLEIFRSEIARTERLASLGTIGAVTAHEMGQPLTVLRLSVENAMDELKRSSAPDTVRNKLQNSLTEISAITSMVDRFRSFARRSSHPSVSEVDLQALSERMLSLLGTVARQKGTVVRLESIDRLPHIRSNLKDLEQLFFALIENAMGAGGERENRQIVISGDVVDNHVELRFTDNCGGIAPENLDKIFEPFFSTKPEGTGLGLSVVQDVVSRSGGKIRVESKFGEGSTFFVTLPIG